MLGMSRPFFAVICAVTLTLCSLVIGSNRMEAADAVKYIDANPETGTSKAVIVEGVSLAHTAQIFPIDDFGKLVSFGDAERQSVTVFQRIDRALKEHGSSLQQAVKLNVYLTSDELQPKVSATITRTFPGPARPAVTFVTTPLPMQGALVAMDAVAVSNSVGKAVVRNHVNSLGGNPNYAQVALLPAGSVVYISGQAEKGKDVAEATRKTMESLHRTLKFLNLDASHVVHIKTFVTPMAQYLAVEKELHAFYPGAKIPPISHVEWTYGLIEIEMIAYVPAKSVRPAAETVSYLTPPGMTTSPVYSRLAIVEGGRLIFIGGLYGKPKGDGARQVRDIFAELQELLQKCGSDLKHLAKATYYVSDDDPSKQLNAIRPEFYDPKRPPAASKAGVKGVGMKDRSLVIDMIAAPAPHKSPAPQPRK